MTMSKCLRCMFVRYFVSLAPPFDPTEAALTFPAELRKKLNIIYCSTPPSIDARHPSRTPHDYSWLRFLQFAHHVPVTGSPRRPEGDAPRFSKHILRIQHLFPEPVTTRLCVGGWLVASIQSFRLVPGTNCGLEEKDLVIIGGGVAGYVAAIKAGQAGLKVSQIINKPTGSNLTGYLGRMYRKAWLARRYLSQRRLHSLKVASKQLAPLPPDPPRHQGPRYRGRRCQAQPPRYDEGKGHLRV